MNTQEVIDALSTNLRRHILMVLIDGPNTTMGVLQSLKARGLPLRHRETAYRALEKLVRAGLVTKFYSEEKGLCYKLKSTKIAIEIGLKDIKTEQR